MAVTVATFRQNFPEFQDQSRFSDAAVNLWLAFSASLVNPDVWNADGGTLADLGTQLVIAHHLVLGERDAKASQAGGTPGTVTGPQASKSVDKVSVSYDSGAVRLEDAGFWGLTSYGLRFLTIARVLGAGGGQFGSSSYGPGPYGGTPLGF